MRVAGGSSSSSLGASQIFCETRLSADGAEDWDFWIFGFRDDDCRGGRQGEGRGEGQGNGGGGGGIETTAAFACAGRGGGRFSAYAGMGPGWGPSLLCPLSPVRLSPEERFD